MPHHLYYQSIPTKLERLNHAAKTIQRYKDGGMNAAKRTIQWFISADSQKTIFNQ